MNSYFKKLGFRKTITLAMILISGFLAIVCAIILILNPSPDFNALPEQSAQVEVLGKSSYTQHGSRHTYYVHFKFPDGMDRIFKVNSKIYNTINKNETGILFYKEGRTYLRGGENVLFVKFERD